MTCGPEKRDDNIFVVGCQRSGTSVVWAALIAHPDLKPLHPYDPVTGFDPKELYYFRNIFEARNTLPSPMYGWDVDRAYLQTLVDATVRFCAENHGAASGRWISAHPADALHLPELLKTMPGIRVVNVLRHPEEVVWSAVHARWSRDDPRPLEDRAAPQARHWRAFAEMALRVEHGEFGDSVLNLRHDQIVEQPADSADRLAAHVGVDPHPEVLGQLISPVFNSSFGDGKNANDLVLETRRAISQASGFRRAVVDQVGDLMDALRFVDLGNPPLVPRRT